MSTWPLFWLYFLVTSCCSKGYRCGGSGIKRRHYALRAEYTNTEKNCVTDPQLAEPNMLNLEKDKEAIASLTMETPGDEHTPVKEPNMEEGDGHDSVNHVTGNVNPTIHAEGKSQLLGMGTTMVDLVMPDGCAKRIEGFIKYIPEDFVVNEIDPNGNIVISRRSLRPSIATQAVEHERNRTSGEAFLKLRKVGNPIGTMKYPSDMFTKEDSIRIDALLDDLMMHMTNRDLPDISMKKPPFCLVMLCDTDNQKELRTRAHVFIRENLPFLDSTAISLGKLREKKETAQYVERFMSQSEVGEDTKLVVKIFPRPTCVRAIQDIRATSDDWLQDVLKDMPSGDAPSLESVVKHLDVTDYSNFPTEFKERQKMKQYLHFTVQKRDRSTHEITNMLCRVLHRSSHDIFTAGNKDRRAVSTQRFCVRRAKIEDFVAAMAQAKWMDSVIVSDFQYSRERLRLGDLRGNSFWVTIRGITDVTSARLSLESLRVHGFLNYFGLQRFGSLQVGTHLVGAAMLRRDYEDVVRLIINNDDVMGRYLAVRGTAGNKGADKMEEETSSTAEALNSGNGIEKTQEENQSDVTDEDLIFTNGSKRQCTAKGAVGDSSTDRSQMSAMDTKHQVDDIDPATVIIDENVIDTLVQHEDGSMHVDEMTKQQGSRNSFIERNLISGITRNQSIEGALRRIPSNVLSIYVHATQSLVFNYVLTERLKKYGMRPVPGDFVIRASPSPVANSYESKSVVGAMLEVPSPTAGGGEAYEQMGQHISVVTSNDVEKWSIYDIVLPLPGDNVEYPEFLKPIYERVVKEHFNLSLDMFTTVMKDLPSHLKGRERCLVGVGGGYRHIVARAHNLQYYLIPELLMMSPEASPDVPPPFMRMRSQRTAENGHAHHLTLEHKHDGRTKCADCRVAMCSNTLVVSCALPKSCYLTCALRELLTDESLERQYIA